MLGTVWKRWNWLEDGLIPLTAALMYAAWSYPLFKLFISHPSFTFWLCLGVLLAGAVAGHLASQNRMGAVIVVVGGFAAIMIALFLTMPADAESLGAWFGRVTERVAQESQAQLVPVPVIVALCTFLLWWRGVGVASSGHTNSVGSFISGVIVLAGLLVLATTMPAGSPSEGGMFAALAPFLFLASIPATLLLGLMSRVLGDRAAMLGQASAAIGLLFLSALSPNRPSTQALVGWILLFLASGLATLALLGVLDTLREQQRKTGVRLRIDRYWVITMLAVIAGVLVVGVLVGQLIAPATVLWVLGWLRPIWSLLVQIFLLIVFVFAYLFFSLLEPLLAGIEGRPRQPVPQPGFSPVGMEDLEKLAPGQPIHIPPIVIQIVLVILGLGGVALIAYILYLAIRRMAKADTIVEDDIVETRETILSADLLRSQLQDLLAGLRRRAPPPFVDPGQQGDPRRIVRELYQKVLARASELNTPRGKGQTPTTYQRTLSYLCSGESVSLETLTAAYMVARYGVVPPTEEQVQAAQAAFVQIDAALQSKIRAIEG